MPTHGARNITLVKTPEVAEPGPRVWLFWQIDDVWWSAHFWSVFPAVEKTEFIGIDAWKFFAEEKYEWASTLEVVGQLRDPVRKWPLWHYWLRTPVDQVAREFGRAAHFIKKWCVGCEEW